MFALMSPLSVSARQGHLVEGVHVFTVGTRCRYLRRFLSNCQNGNGLCFLKRYPLSHVHVDRAGFYKYEALLHKVVDTSLLSYLFKVMYNLNPCEQMRLRRYLTLHNAVQPWVFSCNENMVILFFYISSLSRN